MIQIDVALDVQPKDFTILSLNCQSLPAKIDNLTVLLETIATDFKVSAICLQETWLSNDSDTSLFELYGYKLISAGKFCSVHSGLMIYLSDEYNFKCLNLHEQSSIWDGLFIEVYGKPLNRKKLVIGNIYRPPRETIENYHTFSSELAPILTFLNKSKCEVVIAGDFNIDLLKLNENNNVRLFFDTIVSHAFYPTITLPTRFSDRRCTLIDNFICKFSPEITNYVTVILTNHISDHQPYVINIRDLNAEKRISKFIQLSTPDSRSMDHFKTAIQKDDIFRKLNKEKARDPNDNYEIIDMIIKDNIKMFCPVRVVKYHKHKYKKTKWITKGIIKSIKFRDNLYKKLKQTSPDSQNFNMLKINLRAYNKILKRSIKLAKTDYYQFSLTKYKNDIQGTWRIIKDILNKTQKKKATPNIFW